MAAFSSRMSVPGNGTRVGIRRRHRSPLLTVVKTPVPYYKFPVAPSVLICAEHRICHEKYSYFGILAAKRFCKA